MQFAGSTCLLTACEFASIYFRHDDERFSVAKELAHEGRCRNETTAVSNGDSLIGIIGAGAVGKAVIRQAVRVGIDIVVCNRRGPEALAPFLAEMGPRVRAGRLADVVKPEIVVVAIPWPQVAGVLAQVAHWESRILIDATNPIVPPDMRPEEVPGTTSSEIVERLAPGAQVVKAFNTLPAALLEADPATAGGASRPVPCRQPSSREDHD